MIKIYQKLIEFLRFKEAELFNPTDRDEMLRATEDSMDQTHYLSWVVDIEAVKSEKKERREARKMNIVSQWEEHFMC